MNKKYFLLKDKTRLTYIHSNEGKNFNWLFLPGGPGIGSEYFDELTNQLSVSRNIWHIDLPNNGSNRIVESNYLYGSWRECLNQAVSIFDNTILVAHSFGAMFALNMPEIERHLKGFVIMNSSPGPWQEEANRVAKQYGYPPIDKIRTDFDISPTDANMKDLMIKTPYFRLPNEDDQRVRKFYENVSINHKPFLWAQKSFFPTYQAAWIPKIPTLIIGSEYDFVTPISLFKNDDRFKKFKIEVIKGASHHPWFEKCEAVQNLLLEFLKSNDTLYSK